MSHPLVLALFDTPDSAAEAARAVHRHGIDREHLSVVARSHQEQGELAKRIDATPGAEIEDSRAAARLGELGGQILAAIAVIMPGIGPIVAAGPLSAGLGEAAGHAAGGVASVLADTGIDEARARQWQDRVHEGAILLGVHVISGAPEPIRDVVQRSGATDVEIARWDVEE